MNIQSAIKFGAKILKFKYINNPYLDAEILMAKAIKKDRNYVLLNFNKNLHNEDFVLILFLHT